MGSGSNHDHWPQIGWLRAIAGNGGGGARRGNNSRGGAARGSPDFTVSGVPRLKMERAWVGEALEGTCDAPRASKRRGKVRSSVHGRGGGPGAPVLPASAHSRGTELSSGWYGFGANARSSTEPIRSLRGLPGKAVTLRHGGAALCAAAASQSRRLGPCA